MDLPSIYNAMASAGIIEWLNWFQSQIYLKNFVALVTTIFVIAFIYLQFKKNVFAFNFPLTEAFNKSQWDEVEDISDLIHPTGIDCQLFSNRVESKKEFLSTYLEDASSTVTKRSTQWCLNYYLSLNEIQGKNILVVNHLITQVNEQILERLGQAIVTSREKCKVFMEEYTLLQQNVLPPIEDLTNYNNSNGCLIVETFLSDLAKQITFNLGGLDKLDTVPRMKPSLVNLILVVKCCTKYQYNIGSENTELLKQIYLQLTELKNIYKEIIEFMQYRYEQSENSLCGINIDLVRSKVSVLYFQSHEEALVEAFSDHPKEYPFKIPNIMSQSENLLEIRNQAEYQKVRSAYLDLSSLSVRYSKLTSLVWPAYDCLPNFSTHDFKPRISISKIEDYELVLVMYSDYTKRLELLKQGWATSLRSLINAIEPMEPFIKTLAI